MHVLQTSAFGQAGTNGVTGDCARNLVVMALGKGFEKEKGKKVALVQLRKRKDVKYGITIVNLCQVIILLNEIHLCKRSDFRIILPHGRKLSNLSILDQKKAASESRSCQAYGDSCVTNSECCSQCCKTNDVVPTCGTWTDC